MRRFQVYILMLGLLAACENPPLPQDDPSTLSQRSFNIPIPCDKFNNTTDWVYCEPVEFAIPQNLGAVVLSVSFRNQRGTDSECYAELYNLTDLQAISFSGVETQIDYELHTVVTENLRASFNDGDKTVTIRFRNTGENSTSFVSNNSRLEVFY